MSHLGNALLPSLVGQPTHCIALVLVRASDLVASVSGFAMDCLRRKKERDNGDRMLAWKGNKGIGRSHGRGNCLSNANVWTENVIR